jgi:hypothetical protein
MTPPKRAAFVDAIAEAATLVGGVETAVQRARARCRPGVDEYYLDVMSERLHELKLISQWLQQRALGRDEPPWTHVATSQREQADPCRGVGRRFEHPAEPVLMHAVRVRDTVGRAPSAEPSVSKSK